MVPEALSYRWRSSEAVGCTVVVFCSCGVGLTWAGATMQVKTNAANNVCGHTFYVMDASGAAPERAAVERACQQVFFRLHLLFVLFWCPTSHTGSKAQWAVVYQTTSEQVSTTLWFGMLTLMQSTSKAAASTLCLGGGTGDISTMCRLIMAC